MSADTQQFRVPAWVRDGIGRMPRISWVYSSGKNVKAISLSRETGDLFVADEDRGLARIDSREQRIQVHRLVQAILRSELTDANRDRSRSCVRNLLAAANPALVTPTAAPSAAPSVAPAPPRTGAGLDANGSGNGFAVLAGIAFLAMAGGASVVALRRRA